MRKIVATGKGADMRSRRLLDIGQVVDVSVDRGPGNQPGYRPTFSATVRMPFHWTDNSGRIRFGLIPDVSMSAPVAIGDMVVLETIGRGFATTYIGSPAVQPMPLYVSGLVANISIQLAAQGPGGAVQWYRRLGRFSVRGESSAFIASATFEGLSQTAPALTSRLPATALIDFQSFEADLSGLNTVLESGVVYDGAVPFAVRLAALGPYDGDGEPVRPTDPGAEWIDGGVVAGDRGAVIDPGRIGVAGNPSVTVPVDANFRVSAHAGKTFDAYLLITPDSGSPEYTATRLRLTVLEAAWNTDYRRTLLDDDGS